MVLDCTGNWGFLMIEQVVAIVSEIIFVGWVTRFSVSEDIATDQGQKF